MTGTGAAPALQYPSADRLELSEQLLHGLAREFHAAANQPCFLARHTGLDLEAMQTG